MPPELLRQLRAEVGARGLSGYVQRAVGRQLRRDALAAALASYEAETEPFALDELERARDRLARAREEP